MCHHLVANFVCCLHPLYDGGKVMHIIHLSDFFSEDSALLHAETRVMNVVILNQISKVAGHKIKTKS